jgi:hypothetical protein
MYEPASWTVPAQPELPDGLAAFGARVGSLASPGDADLAAFLESQAPTVSGIGPTAAAPSALESLRAPGDDDLAEDAAAAVDALVNVALDGGVADSSTAFAFGTDAYADLGSLSLTQVLMRWQELGVVDFLTPIAPAVALYGGYDLQVGDLDAGTGAGAPRYGGVARSADAGDVLPAAGQPGYVAQLRKDLAELGFGPAFSYKAAEAGAQAFDVPLELAVRELQLSATFPQLASQTRIGPSKFYADGLDQVGNPQPYAGPVSGVVNVETRALIATWLARSLRCPVVIEARKPQAGGTFKPYPAAGSDNLWLVDQVPDASAQVYARDFSGGYALEADSVAAGRSLDDLVLGKWYQYVDRRGTWTGPWADPPAQVWAEREVMPELLVGAPFAQLSPEDRFAFRVIRAVADVECIGYFDVYNAYDRALTSTGLCHWTIGLEDGTATSRAPVLKGELAAFFSYLEGLGGDAGAAVGQAVGRFGCGVAKVWPAGTSGSASGLWDSGVRTYGTLMTLAREEGEPLVVQGDEVGRMEWFRQWHWCFRVAMAARTIPEYRRRMWDYARLRLREVLSTPWQPTLMTNDPQTGVRHATVGDLFTSERAAGIILRWHVNAPDDLLPIRAASRLRQAFANANAAAWGDPAGWDDAKEATLTNALYDLRANADSGLQKTLEQVYNWATPLWEPFRTKWGWKLTAAEVSGAPRIDGLTNLRTDVDVPLEQSFQVEWNDVIGPDRTPTAVSSDESVVPSAGLVVPAPAGSTQWKLTVKPVKGKSGAPRITVTADNGAHVATTQFTVRVGPAGKNPDPPSTSTATDGLSVRRGSFVPAFEQLVVDLP